MAKVKVQVPGADGAAATEVEVELPEGYVAPDELKDKYVAKDDFEELARKRTDRYVKNNGLVKLDDALADEDTLGKIATDHRDKILEKLGIKQGGDPAQLEAVREAVRNQEVKPLQDNLDKTSKEALALRADRLTAQINQAAGDPDLGVQDGMAELLEAYYMAPNAAGVTRTAYDPETRSWYIRNPNAEDDNEPFAFSGKPEKGKAPYKTIAEDLAEKREAGKHGSWFKPVNKQGGGFGGNRGGGSMSIDDQIAEAERTGNFTEASRLKAEKLRSLPTSR
jgi:hypothetical protein